MAVGLTQHQTRWWETATRHEPADGPVSAVCLKLPDRPEAKVRAYATVELAAGYVVRDVRLVETRPGVLAVMMPNRKLTDRCPCCGRRTPLADDFCGGCGARLGDPHARAAAIGLERQPTPGGYVADVVFPVCREAREWLHLAVLAAYRKALAGGGKA